MDGSASAQAMVGAEPFAGSEPDAAAESLFEVGERIPFADGCADLLAQAGLRATRQRLMLGALLFSGGGRHVTADMVYAEAIEAGMPMSRATVYNTLNQFTEAGLLKQIGVDGSKSYFDSNPTSHHHFFVDQEERLFDVPDPGVLIETLPEPLPGYEIARVDVIVHLRRKHE